jgi:hypothetical protein
VTLDAGPGFDTYDWSTGETSQTIIVNQPGDYEVAVTSECGQANAVITIQPCDGDLQVILENVSACVDEEVEIEAEVIGGVAPFTFEWNPDYGDGPGPFAVQFSNDATIEVTVTDATGNVATAVADVEIVEAPSFDLGPDQDLCNPPVILDATNPDATDYSWSTGATGPTLTVDQPGLYSVTVDNACGSAFDEIVINECPEELIVSLQGASVCLGESTELLAEVSGGEPPFTFAWTPDLGNTAGPIEISPTSTTIYEVTVTDASGAGASASAEVIVIEEDLSIDLGPNQELCEDALVLDAQNPNAQTYAWSTGETTPQITVSEPGQYAVTLTGQCGSFTDQITVVDCNALLIQLEDQVICQGQTTTVSASVSGGTPPYSYAWIPSLGEGPGPFEVIAEFDQAYTVFVTDSEGETAQESVFIEVIPSLTEVSLPDSVELCPGESVILNAETEGALTYSWNTGSTNPSVVASISGLYTVNVSSPCTTLTAEVRVELLPENTDIPINRQILTCESNLPLEIGLPEDDFYTLIWSTGEVGDKIRIESPATYTANYSSVCRDTVLTWNVDTEDCDCEIFVPNAFSPDFNGINDSFRPVVNCAIDRYEFVIWNRWGKPVFESRNPQEGWRGEGTEEEYFGGISVYFWTLEVDQDLKSIVPETIKRKGSVTVVR